jgi:glycosyltransferase involved in cell wall biosynthesis
MKVCFISHTSGKGGAERVLIELIDVLKERGVECFVIMPDKGALMSELKTRGVTFSKFPYRWWMSKASGSRNRVRRAILNLAMIIPVAARIKLWKCDVVYTNTITMCTGAVAAKLLGLPHIWHIHEFGYEDHGLVFDLAPKISLWLMDHLSTILIANSHAVAQKYQQYISPRKLKVIYCPVIIPQSTFPAKVTMTMNKGIRCVIVGALQEEKRQEDAILAIGELVHAGVKTELIVVGDGDPRYRKYLHDLVADNELDKCIKFIGYVENPLPFVQSSDVVLMCSKCEAFGRVSVEAMRMGKPVVGSGSGGTKELICNGFNGLLYTPGDYKELAEKIRYLYDHPNVARQMGENGLQWATERFTADRYGDEVLAILKQLINQQTGT